MSILRASGAVWQPLKPPCAPHVHCLPPVWDLEGRRLFCSLPAEFSVLLTLLSSEDEILVVNAAFCLGNCMEVPQVATSLLKTDVVQVLLKLAGSDAQNAALQLNAGIALAKLCTAEPRYAGVAWGSHGSQQAGQDQPGHHAVTGTLPHRAQGVGSSRRPGAFCADRCWAPVAASLEETFLKERGALGLLPERGKMLVYLTGICSVCLLPDLSVLLPQSPSFSFHSFPLSFPHHLPFSLLPSLSSAFPENVRPPTSFFAQGHKHMGQCPMRVTFSCWRKPKEGVRKHV